MIFLITIFGIILEEYEIKNLERLSKDIENNSLLLIIPSITIESRFTILSIYLVVTLSEKWNKKLPKSDG